LLVKRPDAQAVAFGGETVKKRDVEAVEFDASVKALRELFDDARAQERLNAAQLVNGPDAERCDEQNDDGECAEEEPVAMEKCDQVEMAPQDFVLSIQLQGF
jgi:hypothetical protein